MAEPRNANDPPSLERERIMIPSIRHKVDPVKGPLALVFFLVKREGKPAWMTREKRVIPGMEMPDSGFGHSIRTKLFGIIIVPL